MSDAAVSAISGLVGVVLGGFLNAYATTRSAARSRARTAARVASEGLSRWLDAIDYLKKAPSRHAERAEDFDSYVAIELNALRRHLNLEWWDANRVDLLAFASDHEATVLSDAARASEGILILLEQIGDAGTQALRKRAAARRAAAEKRAERSEPVSTQPSAANSETDLELMAIDEELAEMDQWLKDFDTEMKDLDVEMTQSIGDLRAMLDHRLWMVRDTSESVVGARDKFSSALGACREIERRASSVTSFISRR